MSCSGVPSNRTQLVKSAIRCSGLIQLKATGNCRTGLRCSRKFQLIQVSQDVLPKPAPTALSHLRCLIFVTEGGVQERELRCKKGQTAPESPIESVSFSQASFWFLLGGYSTHAHIDKPCGCCESWFGKHPLPPGSGNYHVRSCCASLARRPPSKAPSNAASKTVAARSHGSAISWWCSPTLELRGAWGCVCVWHEEESAGETPGIYKWVRHHQRGFHVQSIWKGDIFYSSSLIRGM